MPHVDGVEHRVVVVDGLRLHYAEAGAGDPLVLLHGWPQHWWCWRDTIGPLAARYRVICPDTRGQGWSEGSATGYRGYRLHRLAADLAGLLDALGIERVRLVGHDWGAAIGYRACLNWPERFERYVALAGVTPWAASGAPLLLWLRPWHIYALAVLGPRATTRLGLPEHALRAWRHVGRFTPDETQTYLGPLRRPASAGATHAYYRSVVFHEIPHFLRHYRSIRLHVPTLHLNGEQDPLTRGVSDSYRRYAEHMQLELIPGCGHFMPEERPAWLLERLLPFLH
jgi:pimeloyl-ACP methyl ester carboxylesterase